MSWHRRMMRWLSCAALLLIGGLVVAGAQDRTKPDRAKLIGLDTAAVEARIGPPA